MICAKCGQPLPESSQFCSGCGQALAPPSGATSPATILPLGTAQNAETSGLAIGSLIAGIFSFMFPAAIVAIVLGHIARSNIRKSAGRLSGNGMALAGLVLGYLGIAAIPLILILAAIAIPNLLRARVAANESSAVSSMRTINQAETSYFAAHPSGGYTCAMRDLQQFTAHGFDDGRKDGYFFELSNCAGEANGANNKYRVVASPITPNASGTRVFCSDESGIIKASSGEGSCPESGTPIQ